MRVVSSLSDCSQQHHDPHSYFHVIFINAYPAIRVKIYKTNSLFAGKESNFCKHATTRREETTIGTMRMTALVKGTVTQGRAPTS